MAMAQTAFRARPALNRHSTAAARRSQRAEMPLFQAFLRPSSAKVTDGLCIKDATTIEPACGSGTLILGAIWVMQKQKFDFQHKSFFVAQDIDIRCVWMAYIQLSLYGIPAVVIHGNTMSMEEWDRWYTPYAAVPFLVYEERQGA